MRTLLSRVVCTLIICCFRERVAPVHLFETSHGSPSMISLWKQQRIQLIRYIWLLTSIVATIDYHSNLYAECSFILYNVLRHEYSIYASTSQQLGLASLISTSFVYLSFHEYPQIFFSPFPLYNISRQSALTDHHVSHSLAPLEPSISKCYSTATNQLGL